ncbi:L10-interacting MYB domain-containing protein-like [Prosopis cineraria]|uniref:L10-interacting MYB domain-containing protein-like n=1 Tax=Prosopis cineraria TaxID=364024 RepID=UPI00240F2261|nr:L10-interacting MYB domain-containing protein-like [Prosopis cineraria]XP_054814558.1 L10-interacting MYB domain-containing protein-like [Prosopis cineraria]
MSNNKSKASWDRRNTRIFIDICLEQARKSQRNGGSFTKAGWLSIISTFNEKTGQKYDRQQFKNKWDNMRKEWVLWDKLVSSETGLGWDYANNTVDASDDWWEKKILENPLYEKFRHKGLPFANELTELFQGTIANGPRAWAPSSGVLPNIYNRNEGEDEEVYRPDMANEGINLEEGSGDSDEILGTTGVSGEFNRVVLNASQGTLSGSSGKRKRGESSNGRKKNKLPSTSQIADAMSVIAQTTKEESQQAKETSIPEVMSIVKQWEEVATDKHWVSRCMSLFMSREARVMFLTMKDDKESVLEWLRYECYKNG